jgi:hypothetical protein
MSVWSKIGSLLGGNIIDGTSNLVGRIWGDARERESNRHDEQMTAMEAPAAEFQYRGQRFWFDAFIDGLNRLPRPLIALGVFGLFAFAPFDPLAFQEIMIAYQLVPEWLALIFAQIIMMFFGGRIIEGIKGSSFTAKSKKEVEQVMGQLKEIQEMKAKLVQDLNARTPQIDEDTYQREMADENKPLSNAAIIEWNRRRKAKG